MLGMAMNSAKLFFAGKLFKDNKAAMRQLMTEGWRRCDCRYCRRVVCAGLGWQPLPQAL